MIIREGLLRDIESIKLECNEPRMFTELLLLMILLLIEADVAEGLEFNECMMQRRCFRDHQAQPMRKATTYGCRTTTVTYSVYR